MAGNMTKQISAERTC